MKFIKMHAAGNDYVYVDGDKYDFADVSAAAKKISDRRFGIGSDGLIVVSTDKTGEADFFMRIFNADGSEGATCGNGIRCSAVFAFLTGKTTEKKVTVKTLSAVHTVTFDKRGNEFFSSTDFPLPKILPSPKISDKTLNFKHAEKNFALVDNGNLHAVFFDAEKSAEAVSRLVSPSEIFPDGVNVESAKIDEGSIICDVCERGSGTTFSCGSGAVATAFAAREKLGFSLRKYPILMRGGTLFVEFDDKKSYLGGVVTPVFYGETFETEDFANEIQR